MGNYRPGIGQLATSRYDFQNHVDGYAYQHLGGAIACSVTIDGTPYTDIQSALTAISGYIPGVFPNATASVTGGIKLTGDLGGTYSSPLVSRLQATPVLSSSPTSGQILGYNGSGWGPVSLGGDISGSYNSVSVIKLRGNAISSSSPSTNNVLYWSGSQWVPGNLVVGGDVSGTSNNIEIVSVTGDGDSVLTVNCSNILFEGSILDSYNIGFYSSRTTGVGNGLKLRAQGSTVDKGGRLYLGGGYSSSELHGGVWIGTQANNSSDILLFVEEIQSIGEIGSRKVVAFCSDTTTLTSRLPENTGSKIIYIGNSSPTPTRGPNYTGSILYSTAGKLRVVQTDNNDYSLGVSEALADSYKVGDNLDNPGDGYQVNATATTATVDVLTITMPQYSAALIEITAVGVGSNGNCYQKKQILATNRITGSVTQTGITTVHSSTGGTWSAAPIYNLTGNDIVIRTSYNTTGGITSYWNIHVKMDLVKVA